MSTSEQATPAHLGLNQKKTLQQTCICLAVLAAEGWDVDGGGGGGASTAPHLGRQRRLALSYLTVTLSGGHHPVPAAPEIRPLHQTGPAA